MYFNRFHLWTIATVMSAVDDAIAGAPGPRLEMPATAEKVWQAIRAHSA